jgi:hypothetical protein
MADNKTRNVVIKKICPFKRQWGWTHYIVVDENNFGRGNVASGNGIPSEGQFSFQTFKSSVYLSRGGHEVTCP